MSRFGSIVLALGLLLGIGWAGRQAAPVPLDAHWAARNESPLRRVLNLPAAWQLQFKQVRETPSEDYAAVVFDIVEGDERVPFELYVSRDGQRVFYDRRVYELAHPFQSIREQLHLEGAPTRGPADAPVTIVEFSDYTCGYCRQFFRTHEETLFKRYGSKIRLVYKHYPLVGVRSWSEGAALAAACAFREGNLNFWALHKRMFQSAGRLPQGRPVLLALARQAGLERRTFVECLDQRDGLADVARDITEGEYLGVQGTPTFFINGRPIPGLLSLESFFEVIDEELAVAEAR
ncbi:MAG: DsbA family protein [Terriglobia bacterium]